MSTKVLTPEFRVAFPAVFQPKRNDLNGKDEYSLIALFKKGDDLTALKKAAQEALIKKFGKDNSKWPCQPNQMRSPFRDQGDRAKVNTATGEKELPQGYEAGAFYLNLRSNQRPGVVDQDVNEIIDTAEFYGGCYARAMINAYAYDNKGNRGIAFGLNNVQKLRDGESFGARSKPQDDFQAVENSDAGESAGSSADLFS